MSAVSCDCTFAYHSVIPPTHCPKCGRCLGCGAPPYLAPWPYTPGWVKPWPYTQPQPQWVTPNTTFTYTSTNGSGVYS